MQLLWARIKARLPQSSLLSWCNSVLIIYCMIPYDTAAKILEHYRILFTTNQAMNGDSKFLMILMHTAYYAVGIAKVHNNIIIIHVFYHNYHDSS